MIPERRFFWMEHTVEDGSVNLLARWRAGDQRAANELVERYTERLIALARREMSAHLSRRLDPEDVVQSVYRSFFVAARAGRFSLERSGDLWRLLLTITLHKVRQQFRHHTAEKRAVQREQFLTNADDGVGLVQLLAGSEPSPEEPAVLTDLLERLLRAYEPRQQRMIELRLQGYLLEEIAAEANCCRHTVLRTLDRFKADLERECSWATDRAVSE